MIILGSDDTMIIFLMVSITLFLLNCFMYTCFPRMQYKALSKAGEFENDFILGNKGIRVVSRSKGYEGEAEVEYSIISKVMETSKYIFIYQKNNQVYIIDKTKIIQEEVQDIKNRFLQFAEIEYVICNY